MIYFLKAFCELIISLIAITVIAPFAAIAILLCEILDVLLTFYEKIFHRKEYEEYQKGKDKLTSNTDW